MVSVNGVASGENTRHHCLIHTLFCRFIYSYVAVVGLPDPRKDHAVIMARFARDCLQTVNDLTKKLEVTLGPDTGDLQIRTGLHSGPVTAGVLRGEVCGLL